MLIGKALPRDFAVESLFKTEKCSNIQTFLKMGQSASCLIGVNQKNTLEFEALWCEASNFMITFLAGGKLEQSC